jgi:hypothetical protein
MKVFISWSGERSRLVAEALRYWLPKVIQAIQPWMSSSDIEKGTRWRTDIASELEQSSIGIICLTPENLSSTWLHFEAGALSKQQQNTYVCTFLYGLEPADIREPLAQFQTTKAQRDDVEKLIQTINNALGDKKLPESEVNETFDVWWPKLEQRLSNIPAPQIGLKLQRDDREILEEILELVRSQHRVRDADYLSRINSSRFISGKALTPREIGLLSRFLLIAPKVIREHNFTEAELYDTLSEAIKYDETKSPKLNVLVGDRDIQQSPEEELNEDTDS